VEVSVALPSPLPQRQESGARVAMTVITVTKKWKMVFPKLRYMRRDNFMPCYGYSLFF
jgi:hypothetical protein